MPSKVIMGLTVLFASHLFAHSLLTSPTPRSNQDGLKTGPCGGVSASTNIYKTLPGQKITVKWTETIDHPGYYIISFSPGNDQGFQDNILLNNIADIQDGQTPHTYSAEVQLPNVSCKGCSLQLIQVMTENPANPTNYYSCADLDLDPSNTGEVQEEESPSLNQTSPHQESHESPGASSEISSPLGCQTNAPFSFIFLMSVSLALIFIRRRKLQKLT